VSSLLVVRREYCAIHARAYYPPAPLPCIKFKFYSFGTPPKSQGLASFRNKPRQKFPHLKCLLQLRNLIHQILNVKLVNLTEREVPRKSFWWLQTWQNLQLSCPRRAGFCKGEVGISRRFKHIETRLPVFTSDRFLTCTARPTWAKPGLLVPSSTQKELNFASQNEIRIGERMLPLYMHQNLAVIAGFKSLGQVLL
jgi:hypothetical protein